MSHLSVHITLACFSSTPLLITHLLGGKYIQTEEIWWQCNPGSLKSDFCVLLPFIYTYCCACDVKSHLKCSVWPGPLRILMYWHPFFLPSFLFFPPSFLPSVCIFHTIQSSVHLSILLPWKTSTCHFCPPDFIPGPACSDKDLLSQTRTLAMSFVKCASTDTEHQYKLVKDISFWGRTRTYTRTRWHMIAFDRMKKKKKRLNLKEHSCFFAHNIQTVFTAQRAATGSGETGLHGLVL